MVVLLSRSWWCVRQHDEAIPEDVTTRRYDPVEINEELALAEAFEHHRPRLRAVAVRMLGSAAEADDAVQEAWLRLARHQAGGEQIDELAAWLTTVVGRICLDHLRWRKARLEEPLPDESRPDEVDTPASVDPEEQALLADSVGAAMLAVLDTLAPAERVAFVLHDLFAVPFEQVAPLVGKSTAATRQLASRGRRRVQGRDAGDPHDPARQREVVAAFLAASREGDFSALVELLDPDVELRADATMATYGNASLVRGSDAVAAAFSGRAKAAIPRLVDGRPGAIWIHRGETKAVFDFTIVDGIIVAIDLLGDPETLAVIDFER
jgi:RNA polymerase sigma factor (sigma-70 family)